MRLVRRYPTSSALVVLVGLGYLTFVILTFYGSV